MKYLLASLLFLIFTEAAHAENSPLKESTTTNIEYASPKAAYEALSKKQGVSFRQEENGWVVAYDKGASTLWSFAPKSDPSFPSVVKRTVEENNNELSIRMGVLCGASKEACDRLVREFADLNEKIKLDIKKKSESKK